MTWLRNAWYAAAWSDEITTQPFGRTLLDQAIVFFRNSSGTLVALDDRCPHRFAPLSMGKVCDDVIECGYHGLRFDGSGACVHNPHGDGKIPRAAQVQPWRVEERWGLVWLWPGEADQCDVNIIPDLSHLERADLGHVKGYMGMKAHYQLGIDNLIDLSHAQFVHGDRLGSSNFSQATVKVEQDEKRIANLSSIPDSDVPPAYRDAFSEDTRLVDLWLDSFWMPPGIVTNDIGATLPGQSRAAGVRSTGVHIVTPETMHSSHYFFCNSRNHKINDAAADEKIREWQRVGFGLQDKPIIEATARMMGDEVDPLKLKPILLQTDAGAVRARRALQKLIAEEMAGSNEVAIPLAAIGRTAAHSS